MSTSRNVLIVEKQTEQTEVLRSFCEIMGFHRIEWTDNPMQALELIFDSCADVVFLDLDFVRKGHFEIGKILKETSDMDEDSMKVIFTQNPPQSFQEEVSAMGLSHHYGGSHLLTRPYTIRELARVVGDFEEDEIWENSVQKERPFSTREN